MPTYGEPSNIIGLPLAPAPQQWMRSALCAQADPELFFPEKGTSNTPAKEVCARCPVRPDCLSYALEQGETFGVWGGMSSVELRAVRMGRRKAAA